MTDTATDSDATAGADPLPPPADLAELAARLDDEVARLDRELGEVDLLINQAKTEALRHETRRSAAADKFAAVPREGDRAEILDLAAQVVNFTRRAALMESQVEVLEGKRRALARHRDTMASYAAAVAEMSPGTAYGEGGKPDATRRSVVGDLEGSPAAVSKLVLSGQEDLRREIARAMHDGPAQSLTNIVLQAQIVERLVSKDPTQAGGEVQQLVAMVQQTLEATKTFIFDVRPMVLDDLGLVPTLKRTARERGQRAGIAVEFDTMGQDRRLSMDLESGLFRMVDETVLAYLDRAPDRVAIRFDWTPERVEARVTAEKAVKDVPMDPELVDTGQDLPPALARMMDERRAKAQDRIDAARREAIVALPPTTWREIQGRAATLGITAELLAEGSELHLVAEAPPDADG
jgi:two-component system, NarL family, sensor histidine kinase DegS